MAKVPDTSVTLLRDLACDTQHARWGEFVARYKPMMESFMFEHFPSVDAEDVIQETLIALIRVFPIYHYVPNEKGSFHNYLTGILRHKVLKMAARESARTSLHEAYAKEPTSREKPEKTGGEDWRDSVFEIALQQYMADETINERTRQIFVRVAVNGEKPEAVAKAFGIERNAVDQIKRRSMVRLRELVKALEQVDDVWLGNKGV